MTLQPSDAQQLTKQLVRMGRPQNVVFSGLLAVEISFLLHQWQQGVIRYALLLCLYTIAASYNNLRDAAIDRLNKRHDNPFATGKVSQQAVRWWLLVNLLVVLALQFGLPQPSSLLLTLAYLILLYLYSSRHTNVQSKGLWGLVILALCYGSIPVLLVTLPHHFRVAYWLALLEILLLVPGLLAKDYKDEHGDRAGGKLTVLVRHGAVVVRWLAYAFVGLAAISSLLLLAVGSHHTLLWIGLVVLVAYSCSIRYLHRRRAQMSPYFLRVIQALLLGVNGLIILAWR